MLADQFFMFCTFLLSFNFFSFLTVKDVKAPKTDFDQQTVQKAPVCWSKYTTADEMKGQSKDHLHQSKTIIEIAVVL